MRSPKYRTQFGPESKQSHLQPSDQPFTSATITKAQLQLHTSYRARLTFKETVDERQKPVLHELLPVLLEVLVPETRKEESLRKFKRCSLARTTKPVKAMWRFFIKLCTRRARSGRKPCSNQLNHRVEFDDTLSRDSCVCA